MIIKNKKEKADVNFLNTDLNVDKTLIYDHHLSLIGVRPCNNKVLF